MKKRMEALVQRETITPFFGLLFATAVCVGLATARMIWTGRMRYGFLIWNLFLAWLPLIFALLARDSFGQKQRKNVGFGCLSLGWLLFFPNAPYIFTDLIHLTTRYYRNFWVDLMVILPCALTGLVLGFLSLYLMQAIVNRVAGRAAGWLFTAGMAALSGVGVYLGRFYRFNSWDVLVRPGELYSGIGQWVAAPVEPSASFVFPALFGAFFFTAYVLLYGLTHLRPPALQPSEPGT